MKRMIGTLFFLLFAPKALYAFNIDTKIKVVFQNHDNILFGQKVVQYNHDENSGILVSSPLYTKDNKSYGRMENCDLKSKRCNPIKLPETRSARRRPGFTMVANLLHSQFLLCQQQRIRLQKNIEDLNGICTVLSSKLQEQYTIETSSLGIVTQNNNNNNNGNNNNNNNNEEDDDDDFPGTEIAIVLDGSGSIDESDFRIAKDFIKNIARNIGDKCPECTFALVQYGGDIETIFNLKESKAMGSRIFQVVDDMPQFGLVTKTASAIQHVLDNIFNEAQGSKRYAKQFLIVITDGEINGDNRNITDVINSPKIAKVTRIAVGVGESFQDNKALNELKLIATDPDEKHLFQVDNYAALNNLLGDLEKNIVGIEGTQGPNISAFHLELAQIGFSADYSSDGNILLGAVGAYDWTGGVMMYNIKNGTTQFLNESTRTLSTAYGYLGYSVTGAKGSYLQHLYIAGAPRRNQTGQVIVFEAGTPVKIKQYLSGHQLGSYYGSELCPLDINGDSVTDLLLVGAPFFHVRGEEGMVYVYHRNEEGLFDDEMTLTGVGSATNARFGFAIANIGDINKDGLNDVAIGAPLEDDHGGSIYIFNGKIDDIHKTYSQRIQGKDVMSGLQYFGQSIDGASDVDGDGLLDITVGAKDNVVVLSSRPVIDIEVEATFSPKMVPLSFATSNEQKKTIQVSVCFIAVSQFRTLDLKNSFVNYTINLDKNQKNKRAMFTKSDATPVSLSDSVRISTAGCKNYSITLQHCTTDCVSAIDVEVNYTLHNIEEKDQPPSPILNKSTKPLASFELQFQKDCGSDDICDSNLFMDCNFTNDFTWIVGKTREASLKIFLSNTGEDSYLTTMDLSYPKSFYFKEISKSLSSQLIGVKCTDQAASSSLSFLKCAISHPVFKKNSQAELTVSWDLDIAPFKEEFATISINVSNTNEVEDFIQWTHYIPTRHVLNVFLRPLNQISKVNIHGKDVNRPVTFHFQATVDNPYNAVIKLRIAIPVKVQQLDILDSEHLKAQKNLKDCLEVRNIKKHKTSQKGKDKWDCDMEECECLYFECVLTASKQDVIVTANLIKDNLKQLIPEKADIVVSGSVVFDRNLYQELHDAEDQGHNVEIYVNVVNAPAFNVIPLVAGSTVGGILLLLLVIFILYKCGFFKRSYKDKIELEE